MAKAIAHITGTALVPGVSKNRRWYTPEIIAGAVAKAQQRIGGDGLPLTMMTHHHAEDDSTRIIGRVTSVFLGEDGSAKFTADLADTEHGRTIAALVDSSDGQPFLSTVSIRGAWEGKVRRLTAPDGQPAEQGESLSLDGWDLTKAPGVSGARINTFAWATDGQQETTERVLITESVEAAEMVVEEGVTYEGDVPPEDLREALALVFGDPASQHVAEADNATPAISKRTSGLSGGGRQWADPGFQSDHKQRYDISTKAKALTAWRYIHQASKAAKYSGPQLKKIKGRIKAALQKFGVKAASSSDEAVPYWGFTESAVPGWSLAAFQVTEAVAEYFGDPSRADSWCLTACNGDVSVTMSSYCMDPAELDPIMRQGVEGLLGALKALDPDMDGDIDVPGAPKADTDGDGGHETAPEDEDVSPATETEPADAGEDPAPAGTQETEDPAMAEETHTTKAGGDAPAGLTAQAIAEATAAAVTAAFEARDKAKADAKRAEKEAADKEAREAKARKEALAEALAELGIKPAVQGDGNSPAAPATESVTEGTEGPKVITEADVEKAVKEALTEFTQQLHTSGALLPARAGLVVREHAVPDADNAATGEDLRKMSDDELGNYLGGAMAQQADIIRPVGAQA